MIHHKPIILNLFFLSLFSISVFFLGSNLTYSVLNYNQSSYSGLDNFDYSIQYTKKQALDELFLAEDCISIMNQSNISIYFVNDLLLEAKRYYFGNSLPEIEYDISVETNMNIKTYLESLRSLLMSTPTYELTNQNFTTSVYNSRSICVVKNNALYLLDSISIEEDKINSVLRSPTIYSQESINLEDSQNLLDEAKYAFYAERYTEANTKLEESQISYSRSMLEYSRKQNLLYSTSNFFQKFWIQSLIIIAAIGLLTPSLVQKHNSNKASKKIETYQLELKSLKKLIIKAQEDCFKYATISEDTYNTRVNLYKKRINEIKEELPVLESISKNKKSK